MRRSGLGKMLAIGVLAAAAMSVGCDKSEKPAGDEATEAPSAEAAPEVTASATATASASAAPVNFTTRFPRDAIKPLESCDKDSYVLLAEPGKTATGIYFMMHAVDGFRWGPNPKGPGEVHAVMFAPPQYSPSKPSGAAGTFAKCKHTDTCNELAAYLSRVRVFPKPSLSCGQPNGTAGRIEHLKLSLERRRNHNAPGKRLVSRCARFAGCVYNVKPDHPIGLFNQCTKRPNSVKVACALAPTCAEVVSCAGL